jgi:hypothetical protein
MALGPLLPDRETLRPNVTLKILANTTPETTNPSCRDGAAGAPKFAVHI